MRICVVGGGIIGVTSAVALQEAYPTIEISIFSETFSPDTTGDGSAGLWGPYILGNTNAQQILRWSSLTHKWMESFWKSEVADEVGVCLLPFYRVSEELRNEQKPIWAPITYGFCNLNENQLNYLNKLQNKFHYSSAWHFLTFTIEPKKCLPWLMNQFERRGGKIQKRKITNLKSLKDEGYDVVVNCTGIGCRELINDRSVVPVRGQVSRVSAPWILEGFLEEDDDGNYVIPNTESIVLGGTHQEGDYDVSVRKENSEFIHKGCQRLYPSFTNLTLLNEWVGLRPARHAVRLEPEIVKISEGEDLLIIHNYGHGGSGVTLCWGCAIDVVDILRQNQKNKNPSKL